MIKSRDSLVNNELLKIETEFEKLGFIIESTKALVSFAFEKLKMERVEIYCDAENKRSAQIPQRLGFNHEYTFRKIEKDENGNRKKHQAWYIFKEEWNN